MDRALTAHDRCDRCGAQAYVVTKHEASNLMWCHHHYRDHQNTLVANLVHFEPMPAETKETAPA